MSELLRSDVSVFRRAASMLAESIWWDGAGAVRWLDIDAGTLHSSPLMGSADGAEDRVLTIPPPVSAFQPLASGAGCVFAGADYVAVANGDGEVQEVLARIEQPAERIRFNEGKCDPAGRFVIGSMDPEGKFDAAIYSVDEAGQLATIREGIGISNGFEWSDGGSVMWFTDTTTKTIYRGDYSRDGELSNVEPFASGLASDGLARDVDGGFWNGIYDTGRVVHWNARGEADLELDIPAVHVTSVGFGGDDLSTLYIASVRENCTEQQLEEWPLTGSIFQVQTTTSGFPARPFGRQKGN
jgi:sugar lactone lactonase YvrE